MQPQEEQRAEESSAIGRLLAVIYRCYTDELRARLGQAGLKGLRPAHMLVFDYLEPEGSRITDLARRGHLSKQALVHLVNDLESMGILKRKPDPRDARAKLVHPTERGRPIMLGSRGVLARIEAEWASQLGPELTKRFIQALETLAAGCYD